MNAVKLIVEADGGSRGNPGPAGYGALVRDEDGTLLAERGDYLGVATNNVAEYSGLVAGLQAANHIDPTAHVLVRMDSKLVVEQMSGRWQIRHEELRRLADQARHAFAGPVTYEWIPRASNSAADALANEAMDTQAAIDRRSGGPVAPSDPTVPSPGHVSGAVARFTSGEPATIVLVRHGQTPMTVTGRLSGSTDLGPELTDWGAAQAVRSAQIVNRIGSDLWTDLPRPSAVIASPMVRTGQTASVIADMIGCEVQVDDRFAEVAFGDWHALTVAEVHAGWPGALASWHHSGTEKAPGGESYADVARRSWSAIQELAPGALGRTTVVVGHAVQIRATVGTAIGSPPTAWHRLRIPPASITILRLWADGATELTALGMPDTI